MKLLLSCVVVSLAVSFAFCASLASLPETPERKDNVIVQEVAATGSEDSLREGRTSPDDLDAQEGEPFEIIVPVARNFSSLQELFQILREDDDPKEPRGTNGAPPTYVKGTERNSSDYLIFFADTVAKS